MRTSRSKPPRIKSLSPLKPSFRAAIFSKANSSSVRRTFTCFVRLPSRAERAVARRARA